MLNPDGLVLTRFIKGERNKMSFASILVENQSAALIASVIEEKQSRRSALFSRHQFSIHPTGMLAFPIVYNHSELSVFFNDVDALNIYFLKLLLFVLQGEG